MRRSAFILPFLLGPGIAHAADPAPTDAFRALDLAAARNHAADPVLERLFERDPRTSQDGDEPGLIGSTFQALERALAKLGVDRDDLLDALSEVELSGAGDNWREESSGEVGLSFGVTESLSIGPSFGLRYEEENLAGQNDPWSQQLKLGARYSF